MRHHFTDTTLRHWATNEPYGHAVVTTWHVVRSGTGFRGVVRHDGEIIRSIVFWDYRKAAKWARGCVHALRVNAESSC